MADPSTNPPERVRNAVRDLLLARDSFKTLDADTRRELARGLVKICAAATAYEGDSSPAAAAPTIARAQSAGSEFSGVSAQRVAGTTQQILNAVSFPRFVTELINGVFKAIVDSNQQQLTAYVDLVRNVAATTDGFAEANVGVGGARGWLVERFPESFVIEGGSDFDEPPEDPEERAELEANARVRLRPGATMPSPAALRVVLGLPDDQSVPTGDPESLVPIARMAMARNRQQMLATMVMLGLQRLVIDSGRLHASMRFHIDTRSAAQDDRASQFDARHTSTASGSFGYGPWGASATMTNTIGYVSTQKTQTTEEMNTDLDLDSSVELVFKTDYLPLERLAGGPQLERIKVNTLNPDAESKRATDERTSRDTARRDAETKRGEAITKAWTSVPAPPPPPKPGEAGSAEAAEKARLDAAKKEKSEPAAGTTSAPATGGPATTTTPGTTTAAGGTTSAPATGGTATTGTAGTTTTGGPGTTTKPAAGGAATAGTAATKTDKDKAAAKTSKTLASDGLAASEALAANERPKAHSKSTGSAAQIKANALPEPPCRRDVIFVPSPPEVVEALLALAQPKPGETLIDLGCGDGRILVTAAKRYGCRALGYDIDPERIEESRARIAAAGLADRVRAEQRDLFSVDVSQADIVTLYLLPQLNVRLLPQLQLLRPGARVVSHDFAIAGVIPDRVVQDYLPRLNLYKTYFLFTAPLRMRREPVQHEWAESSRLDVAPSTTVPTNGRWRYASI